MQVGVLNEAEDSFDILNLNESNAILLRNDSQTKFIFKNEANEAVMLRRDVELADTMAIGSSLKMSDVPGYATHSVERGGQVAKTLSVIDWSDLSGFKSKTIQVDGVNRLCVLAPVLLTL